MSPPQLNTELKLIKSPAGSLGPEPTAAPDTMRLTAALQTSIDLGQVLEVFSNETQSWVAHEGMTFVNAERSLDVTIGTAGRHRCGYQLTVTGEGLGEIAFTRSSRFGEQELMLLEYLLCTLVYPLRNALLYHDALAAARRDPLTGIGNRAAFEAAIDREVELASRQHLPLSLAAIDIDLFKHVNDSHGHAAGDRVLQGVAESLLRPIRRSDLLFRYGGEEFVALLANTDAVGAQVVAERMRREVATSPCAVQDCIIPVTVSLGVAQLHAGEPGRLLFDRADRALYRAKAAGRNRTVIAAEERQ